MTLRPFIALFTAVILSVTWGSAAVAQGRGIGHIKDIHVFGDILSDNGNLFVAIGGLAPPSPPFAMSSKTARLQFEITKPSKTMISSCKSPVPMRPCLPGLRRWVLVPYTRAVPQ